MDHVEDIEAQYLSPLEKARLRNDQLNRKAREESAFIRFFQTTGYAIEPNQANEGILRGMFGDSDIEITVAALEEVMQILLQRESNPLVMRTPNRERQKHEELVDQLFAEDIRLITMDDSGKEIERKRLGYMTNDELTGLLTNVREGKRLRAMDIPALRKERQAGKPAPVKVTLDAVPPDEFFQRHPPAPLAVTLDPSRFTRGILLAMMPNQLRLLASAMDAKSGREGYGMELITARINGWS